MMGPAAPTSCIMDVALSDEDVTKPFLIGSELRLL
jgi:hypothetical protein